MARKKETRYDQYGEFRLMACVDGYCLVRRPHCVPFAMSKSDWEKLEKEKP